MTANPGGVFDCGPPTNSKLGTLIRATLDRSIPLLALLWLAVLDDFPR